MRRRGGERVNEREGGREWRKKGRRGEEKEM